MKAITKQDSHDRKRQLAKLLRGLPETFTSRDLADKNDLGMWDVAEPMRQLEEAGLIVCVGSRTPPSRKGRAKVWQRR